ncbi:MAG: site-specific integrase [Chlamydiae bacterium]|nr:site-specific integrase [Chlamydiota bacterium]
MAYIEKRIHASGKTTYRVRIRIEGSPGISESFSTRREAKEWALQMEAEVRQGRYFGRSEAKERTFNDLVTRYFAQNSAQQPKAFEKYKKQVLWWNEYLKDYYLCSITPAILAEVKEKLLQEVTYRGHLRSHSTANRYLAALSGLFTLAVKEWNWMKENPLSKVSRYQEGKPRDRFLSKEEIEQLLGSCKESKSSHLYLVALFALSTGARQGEILHLKWRDVDFGRQTATFRETKNGETRTIPLNTALIKGLIEARGQRVIYSEYVFPSLDGKQPADIRSAWEGAIKKAGLSTICFHMLRHTAASHLAMGGASTLEVGAILGHKTLAMVKRYSHLSIGATAKVLDKMHQEVLKGVVKG